ncbi:unnamed protein product, partial [Polarella glacialis]
SEDTDRVVHDRRARNVREEHIQGRASYLSSDPHLVDLSIPEGCVGRLWCADLEDFFPAVDVSREHAKTKCLCVTVAASEYDGTAALKKRPDLVGKKVVPCLGAL